MRRLRPKKGSQLRSKVEIIREPSLDSEDKDLLEYVNEFFVSYSQIPPLPETSLATREEAVKALAVLEAAHAQVETHLKTARALKQLLESKKGAMETEN